MKLKLNYKPKNDLERQVLLLSLDNETIKIKLALGSLMITAMDYRWGVGAFICFVFAGFFWLGLISGRSLC